MLKLLYLVPNVADPAVSRRVSMLEDGGANVTVAGFIRGNATAGTRTTSSATVLGETADGAFLQRIASVLKALGRLGGVKQHLGEPDVIMARNLEMLPIANRLRAKWDGRPTIVYECLDIHRLMVRKDLIGKTMRWAERWLSRKAVLLVTSSPGFLRNYFDIYGGPRPLLLENKVPLQARGRGSNPAIADDLAPIRIGWFGALRCAKSLAALSRLTQQADGKVRVVLRGKPALREFDDFEGDTTRQPCLTYEGPYRNPDDLAKIYSEVHLVWAIDFFEEGQNSAWLLPNRLYEGCFHGAIPIALAGTETARFVEHLGIGIVIPDIEPITLRDMVDQLDPPTLKRLANAVASIDPNVFAFDIAAARRFVGDLAQPPSQLLAAEVA